MAPKETKLSKHLSKSEQQPCRYTDVREPRTATGSRFFPYLERFDAITFVTSSHGRPTRNFFVRCEEQKRAKKGNIRLPVAVRGSRTSVLKFRRTPTIHLLIAHLNWIVSIILKFKYFC